MKLDYKDKSNFQSMNCSGCQCGESHKACINCVQCYRAEDAEEDWEDYYHPGECKNDVCSEHEEGFNWCYYWEYLTSRKAKEN